MEKAFSTELQLNEGEDDSLASSTFLQSVHVCQLKTDRSVWLSGDEPDCTGLCLLLTFLIITVFVIIVTVIIILYQL